MHYASNQLTRVPTWGSGQSVTTLITGNHLLDALVDGGFIKNGAANGVEGAKYDFRISPRILKSSFGTAIDLSKMSEDQRALVRVEPGEVVFVQTIEHLDLPNNITAVLSTKRKLSHQGIIALGGFCIDPLYKGPLFIGLYNFSSTPFSIQPGKKVIAALFYELSGQELTDFPVPESGVTDGEFPDELVNLIRNYKPVEIKGLIETISHLQTQLDALSIEVRDDHSWKRNFQEALDRQTSQIDKLLEGLKEEKEARKQEDNSLRTKLENMSGLFTGFRVVWTIVALVVAALLGYFIPRIFDGPKAFAPSPPITSPLIVPPAPQLPPATPEKKSP